METQTGVWLLAALLLVLLNFVLAEDKYFAVGDKLELRPEQTTDITSILWKVNGNLVAESLGGELTYFRPFTDRTALDTTTGRLEINNMREADSGLYSVEINNVLQSRTYDVKVIKEVPKPVVWVRPLICNADSEECTLTCDEDTGGAEPVSYSWKKGAGDWKESGKIMKMNKTETDVETFSCRMKNPVSEKESEPKDNPFFQRKLPDSLWTKFVEAVIRSLSIFAVFVTVVYFCCLNRAPVRWLLSMLARKW